jgi:hypothetical protein
MMKATMAFRSFLEGFAQNGLFGWAKMPGGAERLLEDTANLEDSEFADLLLPILKMHSVPAAQKAFREDGLAVTVKPRPSAGGAGTPDDLVISIEFASGDLRIVDVNLQEEERRQESQPQTVAQIRLAIERDAQ